MEQIRESFTVKQLADVAGMSARNFARVFVQETGVTPHEFVERARVDAARKLLESSDAALKAIAYDCGFGTADRMRIVFTKRIGVTPMQYRERFARPEKQDDASTSGDSAPPACSLKTAPLQAST